MKSKRTYITLAIIFILLLASFSYGQTYIGNGNKIHENIYVNGVYIGNETKEDAKAKIIENCKTKDIVLTFEGENFELGKDHLNFQFDVDQIVEEAYQIGRKGSFIENIKNISRLKDGKKTELDMEFTYDNVKLDEFVDSISSSLDKQPVNAKIEIIDNQLSIIQDLIGYKVQRDNLRQEIVSNMLSCSAETLDIPVESQFASIRYDDIKGIDTILSEYSTKFNSKIEGRTYNIKLASDSINNRILMPGDEFSFNESTGKRGKSGGYRLAPVIIGGELKESIGGGICQVSSTLYNAALYSGLEITERKNHSIPSSYTKIGLDATVVENYVDFKFKNNLNGPVFIYSKPMGNKMLVRVYGNASDKKEIQLYSKVTSVIPRNVVNIDDPNLESGVVTVSDKGRDGFKVSSYRVFIENGQRKEVLLSKDYYPPKNKVVIRGVKEESIVNSEPDLNINE